MNDYVQSKFVRKVTPERVDFVMYSRPFFLLYVFRHRHYVDRTQDGEQFLNIFPSKMRAVAR